MEESLKVNRGACCGNEQPAFLRSKDKERKTETHLKGREDQYDPLRISYSDEPVLVWQNLAAPMTAML